SQNSQQNNEQQQSKLINLLNNDDNCDDYGFNDGTINPSSLFIDDGKISLKFLSFINADQCDYSFQSLTNPWEEIYDDNNHLFELNEQIPYYLRLVELTSDRNEKILNSRIRQIIKCSVNELEVYRTDEFCDYRYGMYQCMVDAVRQREKFPIDKRINYEFEPELDEIDTLNLSVQTMVKKFRLDEMIDLTNDTYEWDPWIESLANYFNHSFPFMPKNRRRNFSSVFNPKTNTPGAYSPYHRRTTT
ncbi:hypothetical protein BLA29_010391, partial [Euroglyphus maynei]